MQSIFKDSYKNNNILMNFNNFNNSNNLHTSLKFFYGFNK
jgi:hypothetical protein